MKPGRISSRGADGTIRNQWTIRSVGDLLDAIRARPGLFLGCPHLSPLRPFVDGFSTACNAFGIDLEDAGLLGFEFHEFVARQLGIRESGRGWPDMLLETCADEEAAFDAFYRLLDDYRSKPL